MTDHSSDIEFLFDSAIRFHRQGNLQRAGELYSRILGMQPDNVVVMNNVALIARHMGRLELAISLLERALTFEPESFELLANLGRLSLQNKAHPQAEKYLRQALEVRPGVSDLQRKLDQALVRQGKLA